MTPSMSMFPNFAERYKDMEMLVVSKMKLLGPKKILMGADSICLTYPDTGQLNEAGGGCHYYTILVSYKRRVL